MMKEKMKYGGVELIGEGKKSKAGKQGLWVYKDERGVPYVEASYLDDIKHGIYRCFYESGQVSLESNYENGCHSGLWREYYKNGTLKEEGIYRDNEYYPINFWLESGQQLLKDGTGKKIEEFGSSGGDVVEFHFSNGEFIKEVKISSVSFGKFIPKDELGNAIP